MLNKLVCSHVVGHELANLSKSQCNQEKENYVLKIPYRAPELRNQKGSVQVQSELAAPALQFELTACSLLTNHRLHNL